MFSIKDHLRLYNNSNIGTHVAPSLTEMCKADEIRHAFKITETEYDNNVYRFELINNHIQ